MDKIKFNESERFSAFKFIVRSERFENILNNNKGYNYPVELKMDIVDYLYRNLQDNLAKDRDTLGSSFHVGLDDAEANYLGLDEVIQWIEWNEIKNIKKILHDGYALYILYGE